MRVGKFISPLSDQRGVALPMAMLALLILSALVIGFSVLSASEPTIARNQLMVAQARAIGEAGVERAIWALNRGIIDPTDTNGIPVVFSTAPAPYTGGQLVTVTEGAYTVGGFRVTVTNGATVYERNVSTVGWVPNDTTTEPKAHQKITVTVFNPRLSFRDPPAALSVRGVLELAGNSLVDSRADASCGKKVGTLTLGETAIKGGSADVWGAADNNDIYNEVTDANGGSIPADAHDIVKNTSASVFDEFLLTDDDINALRLYAKARGSYYQGNVTFGANTLPNGLIFVDTVSGTNITQEGVTPPTPSSDFAQAIVAGNSPSDPSGIFSGWLIVNGGLQINGQFMMKGLAYAQNDIVYHGIGSSLISGAMVSRNIRDVSSTSIDSDLDGNSRIIYNCNDARTGGGSIPNSWSIKGGTYKEVAGS